MKAINITKTMKIKKEKWIYDSYNYLSNLLDWNGDDITFAFVKTKTNDYFQTIQSFTKTVDVYGETEYGEIYEYSIKIFEFEDNCPDVHVHNAYLWENIYYCFLKKIFSAEDEELAEKIIKSKSKILLNSKSPLKKGNLNQAVFKTNSSQIKLVEEIKVIGYKAAMNAVNYLAKKHKLQK